MVVPTRKTQEGPGVRGANCAEPRVNSTALEVPGRTEEWHGFGAAEDSPMQRRARPRANGIECP